MSIIKKLAGQTAVYGISTMIGRFINYLLVPLYTAKLTHVADYGVVGVMFSYASFFAIIFTALITSISAILLLQYAKQIDFKLSNNFEPAITVSS